MGLPFGAAGRKCLGTPFAEMEMKIVLALILQAYRLELAPGARVPAAEAGAVADEKEGPGKAQGVEYCLGVLVFEDRLVRTGAEDD